MSVDAITRHAQAQGPVIGTAGTGQSGPAVVIARVSAGKWLGVISARLRTRSLATPIQSGSVLVQVALLDAVSAAAAAAELGDSIDDVSGRWAGARYVSTGRGAVWHPNVLAEIPLVAVARVWCRDDLDATRRIVVDVAAVVSDAPVPGAENGHELGDFRRGAGTGISVTGLDPGAGNSGLLHTTPTGTRRRIISMRGTVVTDANVGNRAAGLLVQDVANVVVGQYMHTTAIVASVTADLTWSIESNTLSPSSIEQCASIPDMLLPSGYDILGTMAVPISAGDNWGVFQFLFEEFIVPEVAAS